MCFGPDVAFGGSFQCTQVPSQCSGLGAPSSDAFCACLARIGICVDSGLASILDCGSGAYVACTTPSGVLCGDAGCLEPESGLGDRLETGAADAVDPTLRTMVVGG